MDPKTKAMFYGAYRLVANPVVWCAKRWFWFLFFAALLASGWACIRSAGLAWDSIRTPKEERTAQRPAGKAWDGALLADGGSRIALPKGAKASAKLSSQTDDEEEYVIVVKVPKEKAQAAQPEAPGGALEQGRGSWGYAAGWAAMAFMAGLFMKGLLATVKANLANGMGVNASVFNKDNLCAALGAFKGVQDRFDEAADRSVGLPRRSPAVVAFWAVAAGAGLGVELAASFFMVGVWFVGAMGVVDLLAKKQGPALFSYGFDCAAALAFAGAFCAVVFFWAKENGVSAKSAAGLAKSAASAAKDAGKAASEALLKLGAAKHAQAECEELCKSLESAGFDTPKPPAQSKKRSL